MLFVQTILPKKTVRFENPRFR